jgi:hypothetical protein
LLHCLFKTPLFPDKSRRFETGNRDAQRAFGLEKLTLPCQNAAPAVKRTITIPLTDPCYGDELSSASENNVFLLNALLFVFFFLSLFFVFCFGLASKNRTVKTSI